MRTISLQSLSAVRRWAKLGAIALSTVLVNSNATAQDRDPAAAQALFDQARQLSRQGRHSEACPKLVESNRLDPGIGTQFHLADCYEQSGRIASAWATFLDVASVARSGNQHDREKAAAKRALQLEPRLPRLVISVPQSSLIEGLEIRRGGSLMGAAQWGAPVPVDPGEHELVASAPGRSTFSQKLRLEEGKTVSFEVPLLTTDASAPAQQSKEVGPKQAPSEKAASEQSREAVRDRPNEAGKGRGPLAIVLAGAGVVGLGVGTAYALMATSANQDSKRDCDANDTNSCGAEGLELRKEALSRGNIASVGFIAGGALLAGAGLVWLLQGSSEPSATASRPRLRPRVAVGPGFSALYMQGNF